MEKSKDEKKDKKSEKKNKSNLNTTYIRMLIRSVDQRLIDAKSDRYNTLQNSTIPQKRTITDQRNVNVISNTNQMYLKIHHML